MQWVKNQKIELFKFVADSDVIENHFEDVN